MLTRARIPTLTELCAGTVLILGHEHQLPSVRVDVVILALLAYTSATYIHATYVISHRKTLFT